jgi:hypothetical protein
VGSARPDVLGLYLWNHCPGVRALMMQVCFLFFLLLKLKNHCTFRAA